MESQTPIDYLAVGHICYDISPNGLVVGGTAAYASSVAQALGCKTAVLTSSAQKDSWRDELPNINVQQIVAPQTTTFENVYTSEGRQQTVHAVADTLNTAAVPEAWQRAAIVHLGPIANEINPEIIHLFSNSLVGMTPQGWMRRWDSDGRVYAQNWPAAKETLPLAAAVIISKEDLLDEQMFDDYLAWSRLLVSTEGPNGCIVYHGSESRHIPSPPTVEQESTGAGDIFATAFLVRLYQTDGNPWEAARFANAIAAQSIRVGGIPAKMDIIRRYLQES